MEKIEIYSKMLEQLEFLLDTKFIGETLEEKAINYYNYDHIAINGDLRRGVNNIHADFVSAGLAKIKSYLHLTYRGVRANADLIKLIDKDYIPGEIIVEKGFTSSSKLLAIAERFAGPNFDTRDRKIIFTINGKNGKSISHLVGEYAKAEEVLFDKNSRFLITDRGFEEDKLIISMEEVV